MSKNKQISKNLDLSEKLAYYIAAHPTINAKFPKGSAYVAFSATDAKLNAANKKLVINLNKEGKKIVKAQETKNENKPWNFSFASI